ncbi:hypothetical protein KM176_13040 [Pseudooceanicola sp. CBS1P-1]|uniref:Uncharacterized protein n=1 Tax=Pseudooceanicola albus TaxID=2692189 RepID=A0A6L7G3X8_9RHOB|nr:MULTISPECIES: hypothetical protein [Pseudooceanicola]MBT9384788.1 hypothetical protein [Pseudooceanicola endophyticus]MXN18217.1 hypothetical protein [Pseudooceanicola albus]
MQVDIKTAPSMNAAAFARISSDAWMVDVLAELQEAALDRDMFVVAEQLAVTTRLVQGEIARKRNEARRRGTGHGHLEEHGASYARRH